MKKKRIDALVESQREAFYKFLKSNTNTSRDPRALMIVAVDEPANTDLEDHNHMEDNVDIDMDEHKIAKELFETYNVTREVKWIGNIMH